MSSFPPHLIPATRGRRFCAGLLNVMSAGLATLLAGVVGAESLQWADLGVRSRLWAIGFLTALWLLCVVKKKSIGAMFCLLEIRQRDGTAPTLRQMVARSHFLLAVLWCCPAADLPTEMAIFWALLLMTAILTALVSGMVGIVSGSSFLDRLSQTVVLQLNLPDQVKPRIFGRRIT